MFPLCIEGGLHTFSGKVHFLRIWTSNNNPRIIGRMYADYLAESGMCKYLEQHTTVHRSPVQRVKKDSTKQQDAPSTKTRPPEGLKILGVRFFVDPMMTQTVTWNEIASNEFGAEYETKTKNNVLRLRGAGKGVLKMAELKNYYS